MSRHTDLSTRFLIFCAIFSWLIFHSVTSYPNHRRHRILKEKRIEEDIIRHIKQMHSFECHRQIDKQVSRPDEVMLNKNKEIIDEITTIICRSHPENNIQTCGDESTWPENHVHACVQYYQRVEVVNVTMYSSLEFGQKQHEFIDVPVDCKCEKMRLHEWQRYMAGKSELRYVDR